ncbi:sulfite exporter TauE/SafE family protein [Mesobaculum littorinae]|uniref:Probable membrane transporter protein n=1 Tax=Mesobaculum littorinae TaxID=2486419 RepID=A0A438AFQ4_9RHOB|nr:sulfite exporter TauE/SafE family protein [Mesobaculum littorinae]RVV97512.1 sulfite exporter TauE/SafE family protein [Mesobaculum littorinae]
MLDPTGLLAAAAVALLAGFVKGAVGFAMPMIMISGLSLILPPGQALALLILPTLASNGYQALRGGLGPARAAAAEHWRYIAISAVFILGAGQLVAVLPVAALYLILGVPVTLFALVQLAGWRPVIPPRRRRVTELGVGAFAGFVGGLSGVWGPPLVLYLTALETPKRMQIQVQGVIYGIGAVTLTVAHLRSGVLTSETAPWSALMLLPVAVGMALGMAVQDRLDQRRFRQATLAVLIVAGANLIRRGLTG